MKDVDHIVQSALANLSLREKAVVANLDEEALPLLLYAFDVFVGKDDLGKEVLLRVWKVLQDTHRIHRIK